jgi:murein L,D-transpeptidase YafK
MLRGLPLAAPGLIIGLWFSPLTGEAEQGPHTLPTPDKVIKNQRLLILMKGNQKLDDYRIALGGDTVGPKVREGDHKTPEGLYMLDQRNPSRKFYKSIHISYPEAKDRIQAAQLGVAPGGDVMIHGLPNGFGRLGTLHRSRDWTDGCIAVTD